MTGRNGHPPWYIYGVTEPGVELAGGAVSMLKPSKEDLLAARGKTVPDVVRPDLTVLFVGINPGLYTAAVGHHFARPGNRFWPILFRSGFTPRLLSPDEEDYLLELGVGITNLVARATAGAAELTPEELRQGAGILREKASVLHPGWLAFVGIDAYRKAFDRPKAQVGRQPERLVDSRLWVLPNTSGLNANYRPAEMVELFGELRRVAFGE
jgi:TDG/mug DNA glycosylase family protein